MHPTDVFFVTWLDTKRSVVQVGLDVDRGSVTSQGQQVKVPCETAMYDDGMCSSTPTVLLTERP